MLPCYANILMKMRTLMKVMMLRMKYDSDSYDDDDGMRIMGARCIAMNLLGKILRPRAAEESSMHIYAYIRILARRTTHLRSANAAATWPSLSWS